MDVELRLTYRAASLESEAAYGQHERSLNDDELPLKAHELSSNAYDPIVEPALVRDERWQRCCRSLARAGESSRSLCRRDPPGPLSNAGS